MRRSGNGPTFVNKTRMIASLLASVIFVSTIDRFVQLALSKNLTIDLSNHATGQHGFDIEDDNDRSREIIVRTIEFIKAHD